MFSWWSRVWRTLHLSSFQMGIDSYCRAMLQTISYGAFFWSKPGPEQRAEKPCFPGIKVSEGNLQSLKNNLSHRLVLHKTTALFWKSLGNRGSVQCEGGRVPECLWLLQLAFRYGIEKVGQTPVFCPHYGSLPSCLGLCLCFPSLTLLLPVIITRWMWKFKLSAPAVCFAVLDQAGLKIFHKVTKNQEHLTGLKICDGDFNGT